MAKILISIREEEHEDDPTLTWVDLCIEGKIICNSCYKGSSDTARMKAYDDIFKNIADKVIDTDNLGMIAEFSGEPFQ